MTNISTLLETQQLPDYVKDQFPKFVLFLKLYYQYLEQEGNVLDILVNQQKYDDIDRTLDSFVPIFKQQYAEFIPDSALINSRLLIKVVKDFYLAKGSEQAFHIFFQMVYGVKVSLSYPNQHMIRCSDGVWSETIIIRIAKISGDPLLITGNKFSFIDTSGNTVKTAFCESVQFFVIGNYQVYELVLKTSEVDFDYTAITNAEHIKCTLPNSSIITGSLYTMIVDTYIIDGGSNFNVGDIGVVYGSGVGGSISAGRINTSNGAISHVTINDFGVAYTLADKLQLQWQSDNLIYGTTDGVSNDLVFTVGILGEFIKSGSATATIGIKLGKMAVYPRQFIGSSGLISGDDKLQDNHFYQTYSYVINSNLSYDTWINPVINNTHITGSKVFGNVLLSNIFDV